MSAHSLYLYVVSVLIWGSTWLAIKFQLGMVPPTVSVVWRFALASLMLLAYSKWKQLSLRFDARAHAWMALQGFLLFGFNYVAVYLSERHLPSGLVAVIFSLIAFWTVLFMRIFFAQPIRPVGLFAIAIGVTGLGLVFWPEVAGFSIADNGLAGLMFGLAGTVLASLGSMVVIHNRLNQIPVVPMNSWAMMYGAIFVAIYAGLTGDKFTFDWSFNYMASLFYLALFGSVLAFGAYMTLMMQIGADRAGYTAVVIPIVALILSVLFEDIQLQPLMIGGIILCLAGNVMLLATASQRRT